MATPQKRAPKTTGAHYTLYIEELETNPSFRAGTNDEGAWEDLTNKLNSVGAGPTKPVEGWKKVQMCMAIIFNYIQHFRLGIF